MRFLISTISLCLIQGLVKAQTPIWYDLPSDNIYAIAASPDGNLYGYADGRIFKSTINGEMIWEADSYYYMGEDVPWVCRDRIITTGPDGRLYVATNFGVYSCSADGTDMLFEPWGIMLPDVLLAVETDSHGFQIIVSGYDDALRHIAFDFNMDLRFSYSYAHPHFIGLGTAVASGNKLYCSFNTYDPYSEEQAYYIFDTTGVIDLVIPNADALFIHAISADAGNLYHWKSDFGSINSIERLAYDFSAMWSIDLPYFGFPTDTIIKQVVMPDDDLVAVFSYVNAGTYCTRLVRYTPDGILKYITEPMLCSSSMRFSASSIELYDENTIALSGSILNADESKTGTVVLCDTNGVVDVVLITGKVYEDANDNLMYDAGELEFPYPKIACTGLPFLIIGDAAGYYNFYLGGTVTETSSLVPYPYWDITDPAEYSYLPGVGVFGTVIENQDFRQSYSSPITDLSISIISPKLELPVIDTDPTVGNISCIVNNLGNQVSDDAQVKMALQSYINITGTTPPADMIMDTTIYWTTDNLNPFASSSFAASVEIYFDPVLLEDSAFITGEVIPVEPDIYTDDNIDTVHNPWLYCLDPNHKFNNPAGETEMGNIPIETEWIQYTVQFQNTGDAEAHHVLVVDTLSPYVDITTLTILDASDPFTLSMTSDRVYQWYFKNILLSPDETDWENSIGSFSYRVRLLPGLPEFTQISNIAHIYFDLNDPVATNTTVNTLRDYSHSLYEASMQSAVQIYPNPTNGILILSGDICSSQFINITDISGRNLPLVCITSSNDLMEIDLNQYPAGLYYLIIKGNNGNLISRPVVKY